MKTIVLIVILVSSLSLVFSQDSIKAEATNAMVNNKKIVRMMDPFPIDSNYYFITTKEFWLAIAVLLSLIIIITLELKLIKEKAFGDEMSIRLLLVTIIILSTLFIIMSGYDENQIAPIYGLFGAICGYLFGKQSNATDSK